MTVTPVLVQTLVPGGEQWVQFPRREPFNGG
jgi:hypothetical protein